MPHQKRQPLDQETPVNPTTSKDGSPRPQLRKYQNHYVSTEQPDRISKYSNAHLNPLTPDRKISLEIRSTPPALTPRTTDIFLDRS